MAHAAGRKWWVVGLAAAAGVFALVYFAGGSRDPQETPRRIQSQLANIRGLPFKREVIVQMQSPEEFARSIQAEAQRLDRSGDYEKVTRMLGLLASDETLNIKEVEKPSTMKTVDGYYDPDSGRVLLVRKPSTDALDLLYARQLYHALLDQHFDLKTYLPEHIQDGALNGDERFARKMVVEGESLYASVMWSMRYQNGREPTETLLSAFVNKLNEKDQMESLVATPAFTDPRISPSLGNTRRVARKEPGDGPLFLSEIARGMDRDGLTFVHAVHWKGWSEVEKLYKDSPPVSTEQVLHPEKWFAGEHPVKIQWPDLKTNELLEDWELLAEDVLGELQWRIVFKVHGFSPLMGSAPGGWNGDRYAVFKRRGGNDLLMLMYTAWDTETAATEFASAYRVLVKEKYTAGAPPPMRILEKGRKVVIVEGGDESSLESLMRFAEGAQEIAPTG